LVFKNFVLRLRKFLRLMNPTMIFLAAGLMAFSVISSRAQSGTSAADPDPELEKIHAYKESLRQRESSSLQATLNKHEGKSDAASPGWEEKERHRISGGSALAASPNTQSLSAAERQAYIQRLERKKQEAMAAGAREEAENLERMIRELQKP
jgi:hypothetical protein